MTVGYSDAVTNAERPPDRSSDAGDAGARKRRRKKKAPAAAAGAIEPRTSPVERRRRRDERRAERAHDESRGARADAALPLPYGGFAQPRVLGFLAASGAAGLAYERNLIGDESRPYALIALALLSFIAGSSAGTNARLTVGAGGALVCIGLAIEGTRPADIGVVLCMFGGLLLAGGIHRLGRDGSPLAVPGAS